MAEILNIKYFFQRLFVILRQRGRMWVSSGVYIIPLRQVQFNIDFFKVASYLNDAVHFWKYAEPPDLCVTVIYNFNKSLY